MTKLPGAIFVIDTKKEHIAVAEARKLGITVVAVVDTNCDPDEVDYVIPGNDDKVESIRIFVQKAGQACTNGSQAYKKTLSSCQQDTMATATEDSATREGGSGTLVVEVVRAAGHEGDDDAETEASA
jgi:small subunit ribosomal protein S2